MYRTISPARAALSSPSVSVAKQATPTCARRPDLALHSHFTWPSSTLVLSHRHQFRFYHLTSMSQDNSNKTVYDFTVKDLQGNDVSLSKYKGKVLLITNTAANCGYTDKNYKGYAELYEKYNKDGLEILAFPCNQFGSQMGDTEVCAVKYKAKYPHLGEVIVNGEKASSLWIYLRSVLNVAKIKWNFEKFLVDRSGKPVRHFTSGQYPAAMESTIVSLLKEDKGDL